MRAELGARHAALTALHARASGEDGMTIGPKQPGEKALVIGYGNPSRQDDGVGYHVVNALNGLLGRLSLTEDSDSPDGSEEAIKTLWLQQLVPELAEIVSAYDLAIFVDAHTGAYAKGEHKVRPYIREVAPAYQSSVVSHHLKPETLLALARDLYGHFPPAVLISVRGYEFDFGSELSKRTQELADQAVGYIAKLLSLSADHARACAQNHCDVRGC